MEKESRVYHRGLKVTNQIQKYVDDKKRKATLMEDVQIGFRV
jgi:hypothetical protein